MIPVTENTNIAIAALIYNAIYEQDPDTGWVPDPASGWVPGNNPTAPGYEIQFIEWARRIIQVMQEQPDATDETVIAIAKTRMDIKVVGHAWDSIFMNQGETGDIYSSMSEETLTILPDVRSFLEDPFLYPESKFLEKDPAYLAYLEEPV